MQTTDSHSNGAHNMDSTCTTTQSPCPKPPTGHAPVVSVIIPTFNQPKMLIEAIESVLAQTYTHREIIVIDDGSTDDTRAQLAPYIEQSQITYLHQQNKRQAAARNTGISAASGELIALLDHDDLWAPEKLERQVPLFDNPNVALAYCGAEEVDLDGKVLWEKGCAKYRRGRIFEALLLDHFITNSTVIVRRSVLDLTGLFAEDLWGVDDIHLWLRICHDFEADFVPEPLVRYRNHAANMKKDDVIDDKRFRALLDIFGRFGLDRSRVTQWRKLNADYQFFLGYRARATDRATAIRSYLNSMSYKPSWKQVSALLKQLVPGYYRLGAHLRSKAEP